MTISKKLINKMNKHFGTEYIKDYSNWGLPRIIKKRAPPEGWTEEAKAGAKQAAAIGLSLETHKRGNKCNTKF